MKSVITAVFSLTVTLGNGMVMIVAESRFFEKQSSEFFFFAGAGLAAGILFGFLAYR